MKSTMNPMMIDSPPGPLQAGAALHHLSRHVLILLESDDISKLASCYVRHRPLPDRRGGDSYHVHSSTCAVRGIVVCSTTLNKSTPLISTRSANSEASMNVDHSNGERSLTTESLNRTAFLNLQDMSIGVRAPDSSRECLGSLSLCSSGC